MSRRPPIAIICALEEELVHLRGALPPAEEDWHGPRRVWLTALGDQPLALALCGIGMLSAAAVTESIIGRYAPSAILNFGCAGAHRPHLLPGDVIIGEQVVAYDSIRVEADGAERYALMRYLHRGEARKVEAIPAAPGLVERAVRLGAALANDLPPWPAIAGWPPGEAGRPPRLVAGVVASADRWNRAPAHFRRLSERHGSLCEDMEAGAIALTCASHDLPFLTIKDISNNELLRPTDSTLFLAETAGEIGRRAAALTLALLRDLAAATPGVIDERW